MNILSTEEMRQAEQSLSKISITPPYKLKVPSEREILNMAMFEGTVFPAATPQAQKAVQRMITLAENMRSLKQSQPNAILHMLTLALINILYQDKYSASNEGEDNSYLLQTLKCTLYSHDLQLKQIKNVDFPFETTQLKLLVLQFFSYMQEQSLSIKANRIRSALWIFQHNPLLLSTFTLFLRLILFKIGVEDAQDYRKGLDCEEAIMNLIEYFDLHYRSFGELILFYEDGLFLSMVQKEIVFGEYYQNQRQKENQKQQLEIKSSVKLNMIESFLVNVNQKNSMISPKKPGIVDSDLKLFNFMLENSNQDESQQNLVHKEKDIEMDTPHFKDTSEQFHFQRKRKQSQFKPQVVRNQFQRLIMDESQEFSQEEDAAHTPYLGGENQFNFLAHGGKHLNSTQQLDSPIDELINVLNPKIIARKSQSPQNYFQLSNVSQDIQQINTNIFTNGSYSVNQKTQMLASTFTDIQKRQSKKEISCQSWLEIINCFCRTARLQRNTIASKVVQVQFVPEQNKAKSTYLPHITSPKFFNNKTVFDKKAKEDEYLNKHKTKQVNTKKEEKVHLDRKPAFLKNLKKNKAESTLEQDFTRSAVNESKKFEEGMTKQTSHQRLRYSKFNSCVEEMQADKHYSKSMPKQTQNRRVKTLSELAEKQRVEHKAETSETYRLEVNSKPWQTHSNFIQKVPDYSQMNKAKTSQISNPNSAISSTSPLKFIAPVQTIGSSVYLNAHKTNPNKIVFKLDAEKGILPANPEMKLSHQQTKMPRMPLNNAQPYIKIQNPVVKIERQMGQFKNKL